MVQEGMELEKVKKHNLSMSWDSCKWMEGHFFSTTFRSSFWAGCVWGSWGSVAKEAGGVQVREDT